MEDELEKEMPTLNLPSEFQGNYTYWCRKHASSIHDVWSRLFISLIEKDLPTAEETRANDRNRPVNAGTVCPYKPEQPNWK
ncbi:hypothetical protein V2G26_002863 [Clonostachys chloroleuca]